jgi:SAM-dependent methyltransferase
MSSPQDLAEITRSASEASKIRLVDVDLTRYLNPRADTCHPLDYAFYLLGDVRDKLVVDLGCGSGEEVVALRQRCANVIGIDISPDLIAIAEERLKKYGIGAELRVASVYDTGLQAESVDVVFAMSLLHHLELERVKREICRILKPNGLFIFKEPIRFSWTIKRLRRLFPATEDVSEFEYPLSAEQIEQLTEGFQVISGRSFRTPLVPLLNRLIKAPRVRRRIRFWDSWILAHFPVLNHFATIRVMALGRLMTSTSSNKHDKSH